MSKFFLFGCQFCDIHLQTKLIGIISNQELSWKSSNVPFLAVWWIRYVHKLYIYEPVIWKLQFVRIWLICDNQFLKKTVSFSHNINIWFNYNQHHSVEWCHHSLISIKKACWELCNVGQNNKSNKFLSKIFSFGKNVDPNGSHSILFRDWYGD